MSASNLTAYRLTPAAQNDLKDIWLYTAQQWSIEQADRYTDDRLLFMPEMARERPEFDPHVRVHPSAEHLIIHGIERDYLAILRVLGALRLPSRDTLPPSQSPKSGKLRQHS